MLPTRYARAALINLLEKERKMARDITLIAMFAALTAALGLIPRFELGFGVPITAQSLGIMLCGTVLGSWRGFLAALLFIALVALGLPLLAGGNGGLAVFSGPTAGFLFGFPVAAFVTGLITEKLRKMPVFPAALIGAVIGGIVVLYACGIVGMSTVLSKSLTEAAALVTAFIPGDVIKALVAAAITAGLVNARPGKVPSRA